ncbi:MAG TPA: hypothetical protein IAB10_04500 [Candidatus Avilachnospira avistercoris]|nr:hypothetical protein [Candidatus Avilachnospira avistercoris]
MTDIYEDRLRSDIEKLDFVLSALLFPIRDRDLNAISSGVLIAIDLLERLKADADLS